MKLHYYIYILELSLFVYHTLKRCYVLDLDFFILFYFIVWEKNMNHPYKETFLKSVVFPLPLVFMLQLVILSVFAMWGILQSKNQ